MTDTFELRRLCRNKDAEIKRLRAVNADLLAVLLTIKDARSKGYMIDMPPTILSAMRAAIAKAEDRS